MPNYQPRHNAADPVASKFDEVEQSIAETSAAVRALRAPSPQTQAANVIKSYAGAASKWPQVFQNHDDFFNMVKNVGQNYPNWRANAHAKKYVEVTAGHIDDVVAKSYTTRTKAAPSGLNETVASDGGFLVPPQFVNQLLQRTYENDLMSRCTLFPMTGNTLRIPAVNETSRVDGSRFGGVQATWEGEGGTADTTKPAYKQVQLILSKLLLLVRATDELLEDSGVALQTFIETVANQELQFKVGDALINGDGVQKPTGIIGSPCEVVVPKEAGQAALTVTMNNIVAMWSRMYAPCRKTAVWLINQDVEPQLLTMSQAVGVGGMPVYLPPGGLSASPYSTLLGRPVLPVEFCQTLGTKGDIILWDPTTTLVGTRGGMQSAVSMHVHFNSAEQQFRFIMRLDAKPWWTAPLTPFKGSKTLGPVVTLATRA
jgi:HK97 family phage major capsid protein